MSHRLKLTLFAFLFMFLLGLALVGTSVIGAPIANTGQDIVNHNDLTMPATNITTNAPINNNEAITITGADLAGYRQNFTNDEAANAVFRNEVSNHSYMAAGISFDSGFGSLITANFDSGNTFVLALAAANPATVTTSLKLPIVGNLVNNPAS